VSGSSLCSWHLSFVLGESSPFLFALVVVFVQTVRGSAVLPRGSGKVSWPPLSAHEAPQSQTHLYLQTVTVSEATV